MKICTVLKILRAVINLWRIDSMYRHSMSVAKTIGVGVLAGAAVAAIGTTMSHSNKRKHGAGTMKKTAGKAMHTVSSLIGDVEKMLK